VRLQMRQITYRYRFLHAILDRLVGLLPASRVPGACQPLRSSPQSLLVLKFGGMGEAVLAGSLLRTLKERHPSLRIDFLIEDRVDGVVNAPAAGETYSYHPRKDGLRRALRILRQVRQARYGAVIDFEQQSLLTALFVRMTGIPARLGFSPAVPSPRARMFTHLVQLREGESMWHSFLQLSRIIDPGIPESLQTVPLPCSEQKLDWLKTWRRTRGIGDPATRMVALHLGVGPSAQYRRWPLERFQDLASALARQFPDIVFVLTGSNAEKHLARRFGEHLPGRSVDASDLGDIQSTAALLGQCDLLISADTGIMHLAAAMGTPTVGLFGPNTPRCWAPVGPRATYVYVTRQKCSPCINSYRRQIPETCVAAEESACMWDISVEDVLRAAASVADPRRLGSLLPQPGGPDAGTFPIHQAAPPGPRADLGGSKRPDPSALRG